MLLLVLLPGGEGGWAAKSEILMRLIRLRVGQGQGHGSDNWKRGTLLLQGRPGELRVIPRKKKQLGLTGVPVIARGVFFVPGGIATVLSTKYDTVFPQRWRLGSGPST